MSSLLILGGSGFVGSAICSSPTLESYAEVTSASRHPHDKYVDSIQSSFFDNVSWDVREKAEIPSKFDVIPQLQPTHNSFYFVRCRVR
jgi:saccharopine dehydrogenase-like NADP-dependent oxidoreductase